MAYQCCMYNIVTLPLLREYVSTLCWCCAVLHYCMQYYLYILVCFDVALVYV